MSLRLLVALMILSGALGIAVMLAVLAEPAPAPAVISLREINDTIGEVTRYVREAGGHGPAG